MQIGDKVYYISGSNQIAKGKVAGFYVYGNEKSNIGVYIKRRNQGRSRKGAAVFAPKSKVFLADTTDIDMLRVLYTIKGK